MKFTVKILVLISITIMSCGENTNESLLAPYLFDLGCSDVTPIIIDGIPDECTLQLFYDNFTNNTNNWNVGSDTDYLHEIDNAMMRLKTNENSESTWGNSQEIVGLDQLESFDISLKFRIANTISGFDSRNNVILWGADNELENYYEFRFNNTGQFVITETTANNFLVLVDDIVSTPSFGSSGFSSLDVRLYKGIFYVFLNRELIHTFQNPGLFGDRIFIGAGSGNEIWIDEMVVKAIL